MTVHSLLADHRASAAAEMALVTPLLVLLMFGSVELGKYFMDEHVVLKAVRDGARYAARQPMTNFVTSGGGCPSDPVGTVAADTKRLVRTGTISGATTRLPYWTADSTVTVTVACYTTRNSQSMTGIYDPAVGAPVVTVTATVPYTSLFGLYFASGALNLNASQQAAVTGV
jgi:hypothetical protein